MDNLGVIPGWSGLSTVDRRAGRIEEDHGNIISWIFNSLRPVGPCSTRRDVVTRVTPDPLSVLNRIANIDRHRILERRVALGITVNAGASREHGHRGDQRACT